jgi:hypothetical protein
MTQGQRLITMLRRRGMTTLEMQLQGISVCPWKRLAESSHLLKEGERLSKTKNARGLYVYRITRC